MNNIQWEGDWIKEIAEGRSEAVSYGEINRKEQSILRNKCHLHNKDCQLNLM